MISIKQFDQIYFYRPHIDFRKGILGISAIVQDQMNLDPFGQYLFLFINSKHTKIKALYWDKTGFALWMKYLEEDTFRWPSHLDSEVFEVNVNKLQKFLLGFNPWQIPHKEKQYIYT